MILEILSRAWVLFCLLVVMLVCADIGLLAAKICGAGPVAANVTAGLFSLPVLVWKLSQIRDGEW